MSKVEGNGQINNLMYIDYSSMGKNPKEVMDKYMKQIESVSTKMLADMGYKGIDSKDMNKAIEKLFNDMSEKLGDGGIGSIMGDLGKNITASNKILEQMSKMNDWSALTQMNGADGLGGVSTTDDLAANVKQMMGASATPSWAPQDAMPAPGSGITDYSSIFDKMTKEMSEKNRQLAKGKEPAKDDKSGKAKDGSYSNPQYEKLVKQAQSMVEKGDYTALMQQPQGKGGFSTGYSVAQMQMTDYQNAQDTFAQISQQMGGQQAQAQAQGGGMSTAYSVAQMQMTDYQNAQTIQTQVAQPAQSAGGLSTAYSVAQMQMTDYQNAQNMYAQISQQVGGQQAQGGGMVTAYSVAQMQMTDYQNAQAAVVQMGQQPQVQGGMMSSSFSVAQMQMTDYQNAQTIQSQMAAPAAQNTNIAAMFTTNAPGGPGYNPQMAAPAASGLNTDIAAMFTTNAPGGPGYNPQVAAPAGQNTDIAAMFTANAPGGPGYAPQAPQAPAGSGNIAASFTANAPGGAGYAPQAPQAPAGSGDIAASFTANAPGGPGYAPQAPQAPAGSGDIVASFTANAPGGPGYAPPAPQAPAGSGDIVASFTANAPGGPGYAPQAAQAPQGSYDIAASFINPAPGGSAYAAAKPASADGSVSDTYANAVAGAQGMISTGNFAAVYDNSSGSTAHLTQSYNDFMVSYMASMGMTEEQVNSTMNYYFGSFDNSASALTGYNSNYAASMPNAHGNTLNPSGDQVKKP